MRLRCWKNAESGGYWLREITFPFPPFPGMSVGCHTVKEVFVCQGDLDGEGTIEVQLNDAPKSHEAILEDQGWKHETEV